MTNSFRIYVLTRFNVGFRDGRTVAGHEADHASWLSFRLDLFERFTLPSLRAQTEQRFTWLLCFSPDTPRELLPRIKAYEDARTRVIFSRRGGEEGCPVITRMTCAGGLQVPKQVALRNAMPVEVVPVIEEDLKRAPVDWVVTIRIDSDDVTACDFLEIVYQAKKAHHFISVPHGYVYDARTRQVWRKNSLYNAWISLVEPAVAGQIWTVWAVPHTDPSGGYDRCAGKSLPIIERGFDQRRWVAVRHGDNSTPLERGRELPLKVLTDDPLFSAVRW